MGIGYLFRRAQSTQPPTTSELASKISSLALLELLTAHAESLGFVKPVCGTCLVLSQYAG